MSMSISKPKLFTFGFSAIGVNMLNLIMGAYLCDALLTEGFVADIANRTYLNQNLVIGFIWAIFITASKIIDGIIDVPLANFLDNLNTKLGKRKTGIIIGFIPMAVSFILFLIPVSQGESILNTIWFGIFLVLFYCSYTCVMLAYYACFSEITNNDRERQFLSNVKSVADVIYFVLGYALIPVLIGFMNIRLIALIFFPISLLIFITFFIIKKDKANKKTAAEIKTKPEGMFKSLAIVCKNKEFMLWMIVYAIMTFGIQMFLTGQDVYFSGVGEFAGGKVAMVNACAFGPVPLTIMLYNLFVKKKGFRFGYNYAMISFIIGMAICSFVNINIIHDEGTRLIVALIGAFVCSLGIGTFFSVGYVVPSHIAAKEKAEKGQSQPSMYFAVQGLVGAGVTAVSTGLVWINMRKTNITYLLMGIVGVTLLISVIATIILPKSISAIGKINKTQKVK